MNKELWLHDICVDNHSSPGAKSDFPTLSTVQLFCADSEGIPAYVEVKNFRPWFYVSATNGFDLHTVKSEIESEFWFKNVKKCEIVNRKNLMGFTDNTQFEFLLLEFSGLVPLFCGRKKMKEALGDKISIYESGIDPGLKFFHQTKLRPSSYFKINGCKPVKKDLRKSHCDLEYNIDIKDLEPIPEDRVPPPMLICAYDIEASGLNPKTDFVFQVSLCFSRIGDDVNSSDHASSACKDGVVICVGKTESIDGTPVLEVGSELELLEKFREIIVDRGVQILMGYNNIQYDSRFLYKRAIDIYNFTGFRKIGFIKGKEVNLKEKVLESSALGRNELAYMEIPGRVEYDGLQLLRRGYKLKSYKLNSASEHFFGGNKDDVTYADILEACHGKDPNKLGVIAKYCFQDSWLVVKLIDKIMEISNSFQMSKLCTVPVKFILERGQQIKCFSLILDRTIGEYVCNYGEYVLKTGNWESTPGESKEDAEGFQGATVIDACTGFYPDESVITMDFASLYPSIMRWKELGYTTYINDDKYRGIEGVIYEDYELSPGHIETFAHRPGEKSVLSMIEADLLNQRKITKRQMKNETDPFKHGLLNSKQLAQKVTCNSLYGFTGTTKGMLPLKAIAAAVTCTGRKMIDDTAAYVVKLGGRVIYGDTDSVMCIFPVPQEIKDKGEYEVRKYLFKEGASSAEKITKIFGYPVLLEFECIYERYLLVSKKRYAAMCWETPDGPPTMTTKGLVTVRRDNAPVVKKCATEMLDMLMKRRSNEDIVKYVKDTLNRIESGEIDMDDLTIRKELKQWTYKNPVPHSILAHKIITRSKNQRLYRDYVKDAMETVGGYDDTELCKTFSMLNSMRMQLSFKTRSDIEIEDFMVKLRSGVYKEMYGSGDDMETCIKLSKTTEGHLVGNGIKNGIDLSSFYQKNASFELIEWDAPRLGDRIPYVVIRGKGDINERSEDPSFVSKMKNLKPDTVYYITRQLKNPLSDLMKLFLEKDKYNTEDIFKGYIRRASNANSGSREITSFFKASTETDGKRKRGTLNTNKI